MFADLKDVNKCHPFGKHSFEVVPGSGVPRNFFRGGWFNKFS